MVEEKQLSIVWASGETSCDFYDGTLDIWYAAAYSRQVIDRRVYISNSNEKVSLRSATRNVDNAPPVADRI